MKTHLAKWLPAIVMMLVIFWFSAQPGDEMPSFNWADGIVKKGGHMIGYGLLALAYWRAFDFKDEKRQIVWLLTILYALTDEFHQSFVPGRNPAIWDILIFDNFGALILIGLIGLYKREKRPGSIRPVVEDAKR
jgi:VanZ family protein